MLPDQVSNPGPLSYESGALPIALRGPAGYSACNRVSTYVQQGITRSSKSANNTGDTELMS